MLNRIAKLEQQHLYLSNGSLFETTSTVIAIDRDACWFILEQNIFHPQGGGQPADKGNVDGLPVDVCKKENLVLLTYKEPDNLLPQLGARVVAHVDPYMRKWHSALHTAGHLIDALMRQRGYIHLASNHFPHQARIEFQQNNPIEPDQLGKELYQDIIICLQNKFPIITNMDNDGLRNITIYSIGSDLCGGTHVQDLGEISEILIKSIKIKKDRIRISYSAQHKDMHGAEVDFDS